MVGGLRRPGAQPAGGRLAAREPGPAAGCGAGRPIPRLVAHHALAVLSAVRVRRGGEPQPLEPEQQPDGDDTRRYRAQLLAVRSGAWRAVADRPLRPRAPAG